MKFVTVDQLNLITVGLMNRDPWVILTLFFEIHEDFFEFVYVRYA
jgi:hypothetical protein